MNKGTVRLLVVSMSLIPKVLAPKVGELKTRDGLRFVEPYSSLSILGHPCQPHAIPLLGTRDWGEEHWGTNRLIPGLWLLGLFDWARHPNHPVHPREDRGVNIRVH